MKSKADAVTAQDWRRIAEHMEYHWNCCSEGFNKRVGELQAALTAANKRIRELEVEVASCGLLLLRAEGQLTTEREVSDKLEKALRMQPRRARTKWKDGIDIDVPADEATQTRDDVLTEVAAIRTKLTQPIGASNESKN